MRFLGPPVSGSLAPIVLLLSAACGSGATDDVNGFWVSLDGGPRVVVFEAQGERLWLADGIYLRRIATVLEMECSKFQLSSSGLVIRTDTNFLREPAKSISGGSALELVFPQKYVDSQYRNANDGGNIVGAVTAVFSGSIFPDSARLAHVSYRVEYRDSEKLLSTEEAAFELPRAEQCK